MTTLPLATLRTLDTTLFNAIRKFDKRITANPSVSVLKVQRQKLADLWMEYRNEIERRELASASQQEVIFTTFVPAPEIGRGCVREIRRTKNFVLSGFRWDGRDPVKLTIDSQPLYRDAFRHFHAHFFFKPRPGYVFTPQPRRNHSTNSRGLRLAWLLGLSGGVK